MRFSTQTLHLERRYGLLRAIEMLAEAGFKYLDLSIDDPQTLLDDNFRETGRQARELADRLGVEFIQAHAPFGGGIQHYTEKLVPTFPRAFELCSILGIGNIVVHPLQKGRYYGNEEYLFEENMKFYKGLMPLAREHGVRIAIENMWQRHPVTGAIVDDVCAPPEELCRYYDELNDPEAFTICLDIGHVALCGREPEDAVRLIGRERLGCLHVHDVDYVSDLHTVMGAGRIDWDKVCRALGEIDYTGSFNLEADGFYRGFGEEMYPTVAKFMRDIAKMWSDRVDGYRKR